jgi:hypothetical protein
VCLGESSQSRTQRGGLSISKQLEVSVLPGLVNKGFNSSKSYLFHSLHMPPKESGEASGLDQADHVAGMDQCTAKRRLEASQDQICP